MEKGVGGLRCHFFLLLKCTSGNNNGCSMDEVDLTLSTVVVKRKGGGDGARGGGVANC